MAIVSTLLFSGLDAQGRRIWGYTLASNSDVLTTDSVAFAFEGAPQALVCSYLNVTLTSVGVGAAITVQPQFQRTGGSVLASTSANYMGGINVAAANVLTDEPLLLSRFEVSSVDDRPVTIVYLQIVPNAAGGGFPNVISGTVIFVQTALV